MMSSRCGPRRALHIINGGLLTLFVATVWSVCQLATVQARPYVSAAPDAAEIYKDVYAGWKWWHVYCYRCHGMNAIGASGLAGPSLIEPNARKTPTEFLRIVRNGNQDKGMQAWDKLLDDKQIAQIYSYVLARADKVLPPGRPDEVGPNGGPWVPPEGWPKK